MLEKNTDSEVHVEKVEQRPTGRQHRLRAGAARADRRPGADPVLHHSGRPVHRRAVRHRPHQDRRFAQPVVPLQFQGIPAVRGRNQALPGGRIRRAGGGRGQDAAHARQPRKAARSRHRPATRRRHARPDLAVLGAPGAGARQAAGGAVPVGTAARRRLRQVHRDRQIQRDHPRQAVVRRRHAGADRAVARTGGGRQQQARQDHRRDPQVDGRGPQGQRAQRRTVGRSRDAARNPQRGQARRADLQRPRHPRRLHHRDHLLPQDIVHDRRRVPADHRHRAGAWAGSAGPISTSTCS